VQDSVYCRQIHVLIDTRDDVCKAQKVLKTKRTYNLSRRTIETVQALAERKVAPTQDALVELAVDELARHIRETDEADAWAAAAVDPEFVAEAEVLEAAFGDGAAETWPRA
jgi:predicted transcriptional regulator